MTKTQIAAKRREILMAMRVKKTQTGK